MYIGKQEILNTEALDGGYVKVTLKSLDIDQLETETEEMILSQKVFESLQSEEANNDETEMREKRCELVIEEIVLTLMKYNAQLEDIDYIFRNTLETIIQAKLRKERKVYGNNEFKRSVLQFKDELLK